MFKQKNQIASSCGKIVEILVKIEEEEKNSSKEDGEGSNMGFQSLFPLILLNIFLLRSAEEMRQILELRKCTKIDMEKKSYKEMRRTLDAL